ncbi:MAG: sigma-54 dependent transcriptional regulator [Bacteroidota bacterium]
MKEDGKILIIDDEEDILLSLRLFLRNHFSLVKTEHNPNLIPRLLRQNDFDVILLDMNFRKGETSGRDGLKWLKKILELKPGANVIVITAFADVDLAVEAIKAGAIEFVEKPWRNEKLLATINSVYKLSRSKQEVVQLQNKQRALSEGIDQQFNEIIGESNVMKQIYRTIEKVGKTDANVLILGENGTGKELIARALHRESNRANEVFIKVDLGAIPESLFESELFGHVKGAFTDAYQDRNGRFEVASGGTLFLDEIGNLSMPMQAKLLTVLQNRQIQKVGSSQTIPIDIRLICATNMPLHDMVKEHRFRQDLVYRINTVELLLPPLRERAEDILMLTDHFLKNFAKKYQKEKIKVAAKTYDRLSDYHWPGNIRELRHAIERAVILSEGDTLQTDDFLFLSSQEEESANQVDNYNLEELEKWAIQRVLTKNKGNISKAAQELGITRAALYRRMEKHGL